MNLIGREEEILCSVIGLEKSVAEKLASLEYEVRSHQTDMYFLLRFLSANCGSPEADERLTDSQTAARLTDSRTSQLQRMGFTETRSNIISTWIEQHSAFKRRSLVSWAKRFVEYVFKYDIFFNDRVSSWAYEEKEMGEWFSVPVKRKKKITSVSFCNATREDVSRVIEEKVQNLKYKCWYHGTDHKAAVNIVQNGIILGEGEEKLDFSNGNGFYLDPDHTSAVEWASEVRAGAVIIFKVEKYGFTSLDLRHSPDNCKRVVKWNRSGESQDECLEEELEKFLTECDYILGPTVSNGGEYNGTDWEPQNIDDLQQVCLKTKKMADEMGKPESIIGVVFFKT